MTPIPFPLVCAILELAAPEAKRHRIAAQLRELLGAEALSPTVAEWSLVESVCRNPTRDAVEVEVVNGPVIPSDDHSCPHLRVRFLKTPVFIVCLPMGLPFDMCYPCLGTNGVMGTEMHPF